MVRLIFAFHYLYVQAMDSLHALYVQLEIPVLYHVKAGLGLNLCDTLQILSMCLRSSFQNFCYILILSDPLNADAASLMMCNRPSLCA